MTYRGTRIAGASLNCQLLGRSSARAIKAGTSCATVDKVGPQLPSHRLVVYLSTGACYSSASISIR